MVLKRINDKSLILATRFIAQGMRILSSCVITRLVVPAEYGRFDMILAIVGVLAAVADFGIGRAVCNTPDLDDDEVRDTSMVMLIGLSLVFSALAFGSGFYFDRFYDDPRLRWIGLIVGIGFFCQYAQAAQLSNIARQLQFGRWVVIEFVATLASIGTGAVIAIYGGGIFALAGQQLAGQAVGFAMTIPILPPRWPTRFSWTVAKRFFGFGWRITIYQAHYGLQVCLIRLLIFPRYGDAGVANYGRAWQIRELIGQNLAITFEVILLPLMARSKTDPTRLRDLFLRGNIAILTFCALGSAGLTAVVGDLVRVFQGRNWTENVPELLAALSPGLAILGLSYPSIIMAIAFTETKVLLRFALESLAVLGLAALVFWYTDLWHFLFVYSLLTLFPALDLMRWGAKTTGISIGQLAGRQLPIILISLVTHFAMYLTRVALMGLEDSPNNLLHALARLFVCGAVGLTTSWILFAFLNPTNYRDLLNLIVRGKESPIDADDAVIALGPAQDPMDPGHG